MTRSFLHSDCPLAALGAPIVTALAIFTSVFFTADASFVPNLHAQEDPAAPAVDNNPFAEDEKPAEAKDDAKKDAKADALPSEKKTDTPFAVPAANLRKDENSPALFFKNAKGEEIPIIDNKGRVVFQRAEDKLPDEMTERDFYETITPAEEAVLADHPTSGPDLLAAAIMISRVGRPEFAKILTEQSLTAEGTPETFAAMIEQVGAGRVQAFGLDKRVGEAAAKAAERAWTEAYKYWKEPAVIQAAFEQTMKGSLDEQAAAVQRIRNSGSDAIALLLEKLRSDDEMQKEQARIILSRLGKYASDAMLATMETADEKTLAAVAGVLGETAGLGDLSPLLIRYYDETLTSETRSAIEKAILAQAGKIPTKQETAETLHQKGLGFYEGRTPLPDSIDGTTSCWILNPETHLPEFSKLPDGDARRFFAANALVDASRLDPENETLLLSAIAAEAERTLYAAGLDQPVDVEAFKKLFPKAAVPQFEKALDFAIQTGHPKGGILPAKILGESGDAGLVLGKGTPTVLVRAASCGDRRLRFTALEAVCAINPSEPFPGSSSVTSSLLHFTASKGKRYAVVAIPQLAEAATVGNFLTDGSINILPALTGGDIIRQAKENPDVEFIVAASYIDRPDLRTVAQTLAVDYRTVDIPILIGIEDESRTEQAEHYGLGEKNALVSVLPFDADSGRWVKQELYRTAAPEQVPPEVRLAQARAAVAMLGKLLANGKNGCSIEDLEPLCARLLRSPVLADEGRGFVLNVKSAAVQNILGNLIGDTQYAPEVRQKNLDLFAAHIKKFGLLLRGPDIKRLYARYNASESEDQTTQKLLSDMLDVLEKSQK